MSSPPDDKKDFHPYTIPYTSSGAVRIGDRYVPSSQAVGGSTKVSSAFPVASVPAHNTSGTAGPPAAACVQPPTTDQPAPEPGTGTQDHSGPNTAPGSAVPGSEPSARDRVQSASTVGHVFTGAAGAPIREVPPTRFQQTPQFPPSYVGLNK